MLVCRLHVFCSQTVTWRPQPAPSLLSLPCAPASITSLLGIQKADLPRAVSRCRWLVSRHRVLLIHRTPAAQGCVALFSDRLLVELCYLLQERTPPSAQRSAGR